MALLDRARYLDELRAAATAEGCSIHAYALMTNHVLLLVTLGEAGRVARLMQALRWRYVPRR